MLKNLIKFLVQNKLVAFVLLVVFLLWGLISAPIYTDNWLIGSNAVAVDAIPNLGDNQQIIFTEWEGQSPQDIEDQITYPLTTNLLGLPGVKSVRSSSMFGFSTIYLIYEDNVDFYWGRSRILEKLSSLPSNLLPKNVVPKLGPDATALGQLFWYTVEGRDEQGNVTGGWDLHELRKVQDFYIKNALSSAENVAEVASIGGHVQEYQIELNPLLMRQYQISLQEVVRAVGESNKNVGAKTLEINNAEYLIRGLGLIENIEDIENAVITTNDYVPLSIKDIAVVSLGPKERRGILDKEGAEVVGGVVVSRYGANPQKVIESVKDKISQIAKGLPSKMLEDGRISQLTIVPFYDRTELIKNTLGTLNSALAMEILIAILVILVMLRNLRISLVISGLLPVAVLMVFIVMKLYNVEANIVALSGIAIAIGTMVDLGIILSENIVQKIENNQQGAAIDDLVIEGVNEVSGAIITAGLTTILSFIPVFVLTGEEGRLFTPLAFTKTTALLAAMFLALFIIPPIISKWYSVTHKKYDIGSLGSIGLGLVGLVMCIWGFWIGIALIGLAVLKLLQDYNKIANVNSGKLRLIWLVASIVLILTYYWKPLGFQAYFATNLVFVILFSSLVLGGLYIFHRYYEVILVWAMEHKTIFLIIPLSILILGALTYSTIGKEFMPKLNEGSFLLMPTSTAHTGISENKRILQQLDMAVASIPEIETVVGKAGRVDSALDPAPLSMFENVILYKPEFILDDKGRPISFLTTKEGLFQTKTMGEVTSGSGVSVDELIVDKNGAYYRNWRPHIRNADDIWEEIAAVTTLPGVTSAPKLQPIETRLVMLQTGMRSPMGIKIFGPSLDVIESFGQVLENELKNIEAIESASVFSDRIVAKPYINVLFNRTKAARFGLSISGLQEILETAMGGKVLTQTIEGRERFDVTLRYPRDYRDEPEDIGNILVALPSGGSIPLYQVADVQFEKGPQVIKSENGFLMAYVLFDKKEGFAEISAVEQAKEQIEFKINNGEIIVPKGVNYKFSGTYENNVHAEKTLSLIIPLVLLAILLLLYVQFRSLTISFMIFSGIAVAFAGGFILLWFYGQDWFLNLNFLGHDLREIFNVKTINMSVAVWVGFIALFGIATDDGVVIATYLKQNFEANKPGTVNDIRNAVLEAGKKRIRPCLMTTATTLLALLPIITAKGHGKDILIPMAIPSFGGMLVALVTLLIVPVLYCLWQEQKLKNSEIR
ncbi:Cu(I)/Ag(I) efflux system membrane protein CusA/SilA [Maribacter sedimenticola]|uniref:Cu(I)/Ag(I) efflux system membrane protein CusA/SilA n=1 Tax=Maribacter sedimenticola TaxID=228956 RepID=A0ABY1SMA9_9FLAO|nr:efflux RND transporter permease subunit [Maribacter sedimenticola]SNR81171.1 Cu(I)/Ag(I) efflux system membrane protein CusA/SilA [Maribacter sedimenticola]